MARVVIPTTLDEADSKLAKLGGLVTAKEWERAALVNAFTRIGKPGPQGDRTSSSAISLTIRDFARRKIVGLSSQDTVRFYRDAWADLVERGVVEPAIPGESIALPDPALYPFPASPAWEFSVKDAEHEAIVAAAKEAGMPTGSKALNVASNPKAVQVATAHSERAAEAAWRGIKSNPAALAKVTAEVTQTAPAAQRIAAARETLADPKLGTEVMRDVPTAIAASKASRKVAVEEHEARQRNRSLADPERDREDAESAERMRVINTKLELDGFIRHAKIDLTSAIGRWNEIGAHFDSQGLLMDIDDMLNVANALRSAVASGRTLEAELQEFLAAEGGAA